MPAKLCPSCSLKNPERATTCDCGYHFGGPRLLMCPSCGESSWPSETTCPCGHSFAEDTEETRHMLTHRLTLGWFSFIGGLLTLAMGILSLGSVPAFIGLMIAGSAGVGKGRRMVSQARRGLATLGAPPAPPPKVHVIKKS